MPPGLVIVWSGSGPVAVALPLTADGIELGKDLVPQLAGDDRLSRRHARIAAEDDRFLITDHASRNGTHVNAVTIAAGEHVVPERSVVRFGRSIAVVVRDLEPFERDRVGRRGDAIVGAMSAAARRDIAQYARSGIDTVITGGPGTELDEFAAMYGRVRRVPFARFDPTRYRGVAITAKIGAQLGTVHLAGPELLDTSQCIELAALLAARPELRVVTTVATGALGTLARLGAGLGERLAGATVAIPDLRARFDEVPGKIVARVAAAAPTLVVHARFVEACLVRAWADNDLELAAAVAFNATRLATRGDTELRELADDPTIHASKRIAPWLLGSTRPGPDRCP